MKGQVYLIGAGPGNRGLLTKKGEAVLKKADTVVYDSLVGDSILCLVSKNAEKIFVGKRAGNHAKSQQEINEILLEHALKGETVARLKGGDPFVFGRGGEELELLKANNVPFQVVPGVTSPVAVLTYNGVPITHRDFASSFHIITGHKKKGSEDINFKALAEVGGTLVFLMGVSQLQYITESLIKEGMDADTPAGIFQKGTTSKQKRIIGTLGTLKEKVDREGIQTPAIIAVGEVCRLAGDFAWYEDLPLSGCKVLITRPENRASRMEEMLYEKGAEVLSVPAISIKAKSPDEAIKEAIENIEDYNVLAFTSPGGVNVFRELLMEQGKDMRACGHMKFAVIGSGTGKALAALGIKYDYMPEVYDGESLGRLLHDELEEGAKVLMPRSDIGSKAIVKEMEKRADLIVNDLPVYETKYEGEPLFSVRERFETGDIDYAVFTSASTVRGFVNYSKGLDYTKVKAICIGKQTAEQASEYGMEIYVSEKATIPSVTAKLEEVYGGR